MKHKRPRDVETKRQRDEVRVSRGRRALRLSVSWSLCLFPGCTAISIPTPTGDRASYITLFNDRKIGGATAHMNPDGSVTLELHDIESQVRDEVMLELVKRIPAPVP